MFTLKFYSKQGHSTALSAPCYDVYSSKQIGGKTHTSIAVYPNFTKENGVVYSIVDDESPNYYQDVYIENSSGKTIDHFSI